MGCESSKDASSAPPPAAPAPPPHVSSKPAGGNGHAALAASAPPPKPADASPKPTKAAPAAAPVPAPAPPVKPAPSAPASRKPAPAATPKPAPAAAPRPRPVDSVSMASFASAGGGGGGHGGYGGGQAAFDEYFGISKPKPKAVPLAERLPAMVPGDEQSEGGGDPRLVVLKGSAMTLPYLVLVRAGEAARPALQRILDEVFAEVDETFNDWNPASEVSRLNAAPAATPVPLSRPLHALLQLCRDVHKLTGGRFDPTVGPLRRAWVAKLEQGTKPGPEEAAAAAGLVGMGKVAVTGEGVATKSAAGVCLDLGAVAKGHAVDMILTRLLAAGHPDVYVDWAGDIRAAGRHPAGREWRTAVACPPELEALFERWAAGGVRPAAGRMLADVPLTDRAAATSGDYARVYKFGYFHVFDPRRGAPCKATATSVASATVLAATCALADALATAAATFDSDAAARDFLERVRAQMPDRVFGYVLYARASPAVLQAAAPPAPAPAPPPALPADRLRELMRAVPLPVAVLAAPPAAAGGAPLGMTATSVALCSAEPPLLSFNVMRGSPMHALLAAPRPGPLPLLVHLLRPAQAALAARFSAGGGGGAQFEGVPHTTDAETGAPLLAGVFAALRCAVDRVLPGGDHALVLARVAAVERAAGGEGDAFPALWHARACHAAAALGPPPPPLPAGCSFGELAARVPRPAAEVRPPGGEWGRELADGFNLLSLDPPLFSLSLPAARPAAAACRPLGAELGLRLRGGAGPVAELACQTLAAHEAGDAALLVLEPLPAQPAPPAPARPHAPALLFFAAGPGPDAPRELCALGGPPAA